MGDGCSSTDFQSLAHFSDTRHYYLFVAVFSFFSRCIALATLLFVSVIIVWKQSCVVSVWLIATLHGDSWD